MPKFTNRELYIESRREYHKSVGVYGRLVARGKMSQENHDKGLALKKAIELHFKALADAEDTLPFFGREEASS